MSVCVSCFAEEEEPPLVLDHRKRGPLRLSRPPEPTVSGLKKLTISPKLPCSRNAHSTQITGGTLPTARNAFPSSKKRTFHHGKLAFLNTNTRRPTPENSNDFCSATLTLFSLWVRKRRERERPTREKEQQNSGRPSCHLNYTGGRDIQD